MTIHVLDMTFEELQAAIEAMGQSAYRAKQLADWVYRKGVTDGQKMTNLPAALSGQVQAMGGQVAERLDSTDGTIKLLLKMADGLHVETVLIPDGARTTVCLSTQVGCAMGCTFCASGAGGLARNLAAGEILEQILHLWQASGRRLTHAVFMGTGEPLANYDATVAAVRAIVDPQRFGISARHVTVSTVGLPEGIRRLAGEGLPITLALSLHAPNDALRRTIMPAAARYRLEEILDAAQAFYEARNREITLEYVLLGDVNDTNVCAQGLARIAARLRCNVNLIRYNPVPPGSTGLQPVPPGNIGLKPVPAKGSTGFKPVLPFAAPSGASVRAFEARLRRLGVNVHVRRSRGSDAQAACGQLRRRAAAATGDE